MNNWNNDPDYYEDEPMEEHTMLKRIYSTETCESDLYLFDSTQENEHKKSA